MFKRLKKAERDTDEDLFGYYDEEFDGNGKGGQTTEEKLKRSLFCDDEGNTFLSLLGLLQLVRNRFQTVIL